MSHVSLEELIASDVYAEQDKEKRDRRKQVYKDESLLFPTMEVCAVLQITRPTFHAKGLSKLCKRRAYVDTADSHIGLGDVGVTAEAVLAATTAKTLGRLHAANVIYREGGVEVGNDEEWRIQVDVLIALYNNGIISIEPIEAWMKIVGRDRAMTGSRKVAWGVVSPIWRSSATTRQNEIYENVFLILNIILEKLKVRIEFNSLSMKIEFLSLE